MRVGSISSTCAIISSIVPVLLDQRERTLGTDPLHAGHVVRGVADEREVVHHTIGRHAEAFVRVLLAVPFLDRAPGRPVPGIQDPDPRPDELQQILVARDDADLELPRGPLQRQRRDDVVGLEPLELDRRDP